MKNYLSLLLILICINCYAQKAVNFNAIDWNTQFIDANTVDSLAFKLTAGYASEVEKVRAIYSWITQHISYNVNIFNSRRPINIKYTSIKEDTSEWKSTDEIVAQRVLDRRVAVCDGYSRLFKILCEYSGVKCEIITGFAAGYVTRNRSFRTNHSWNAVMIDSSWKLIDVTWASGFVNFSDDYVPHQDDSYFFASPAHFIYDHYPEDPKWTLMDKAPFFKEFREHPFKFKSFAKYRINSFSPGPGVINAFVGDTIRFELNVTDALKDKQILSDPFFDSSMLTRSNDWVFLSPEGIVKNKIIYTYVPNSTNVEWIHIMYNDDMVLRYKINIKDRKIPDVIAKVSETIPIKQ